MSNLIATRAELINDKLQFSAVARHHQPIIFDYYKPVGDDEGYTGLEGFLAGLCACSSTSIVYQLRKAGKTIVNFSVEANGNRRTAPPLCFDKIELSFTIESPDVLEVEAEEAIKKAEAELCPVWAMIKGNVEVRSKFILRKV